MAMVITGVERPVDSTIAKYRDIGVATVHETQGRKGLLHPSIGPIYKGARIVGPAITVNIPAYDNWMIHVAVEQH